MKEIKSFVMSTKDISPSTAVKTFKVTGDEGAVFSLRIQKSDGNFYNFRTASFDSSINTNGAENVLSNISTDKNGYDGSVVLPANGSGDTYSFMLYAEPHFDTVLSRNLLTINTTGSGDNLIENTSYSPYFYKTRLTQIPASTITLTKASKLHSSKFADGGSNYGNADVTVSRAANIKGKVFVSFDWSFETTKTDDSNGFQLIRQPIESDFEISSDVSPGGTSYLVSEANHASKEVQLTTVGGLLIGDFISNNYSGATIPVITSIDEDNNIISLSVVQTLAAGVALTFSGGGPSTIESYSGASGIQFTSLTAEVPEFKVKLSSAHSGTGPISVDNTDGLFLGQKIKGPDFDNKTGGEMVISAIDRSGNTFTVGAAQTLKDNVELTISGGGNVANIKGKFSVSTFPTSDIELTLDLDKILTTKATS